MQFSMHDPMQAPATTPASAVPAAEKVSSLESPSGAPTVRFFTVAPSRIPKSPKTFPSPSRSATILKFLMLCPCPSNDPWNAAPSYEAACWVLPEVVPLNIPFPIGVQTVTSFISMSFIRMTFIS